MCVNNDRFKKYYILYYVPNTVLQENTDFPFKCSQLKSFILKSELNSVLLQNEK